MYSPEHYIHAHLSASNILVVSGRNGSRIGLIATDLKTADSHRGRSCQTSLQFIPEENGIIAIGVAHNAIGKFNKTSTETTVMLLEVSGGQVRIDRYWQPELSACLCSIEAVFGNNFIRVVSENRNRYTNNPICEEGEYHVEDPTLLCKYVTGKMSEEALQEEAAYYIKEISAQQRVLKLETELIERNAQLRDLNDRIRNLQEKVALSKESAGWFGWRRQLTDILVIIDDLGIKA